MTKIIASDVRGLIAKNEDKKGEPLYFLFTALAEALERAEFAEEALRDIASYVGSGGYNAPEVAPAEFLEKIRDGIEHLVDVPVKMAKIQGFKDGYEFAYNVVDISEDNGWHRTAPYIDWETANRQFEDRLKELENE